LFLPYPQVSSTVKRNSDQQGGFKIAFSPFTLNILCSPNPIKDFHQNGHSLDSIYGDLRYCVLIPYNEWWALTIMCSVWPWDNNSLDSVTPLLLKKNYDQYLSLSPYVVFPPIIGVGSQRIKIQSRRKQRIQCCARSGYTCMR
jgi:hypothetical protein